MLGTWAYKDGSERTRSCHFCKNFHDFSATSVVVLTVIYWNYQFIFLFSVLLIPWDRGHVFFIVYLQYLVICWIKFAMNVRTGDTWGGFWKLGVYNKSLLVYADWNPLFPSNGWYMKSYYTAAVVRFWQCFYFAFFKCDLNFRTILSWSVRWI